MRRRIDAWTVEEMVRALERDPDICLVLNKAMQPENGMPRISRDGKRWLLHRYLLYRISGEDTKECLLVSCQTPRCLNPLHFERSMRRGRRIRTHCPNDHEYTPDNIEMNGAYKCKRCQEDRRARHRKGEYGRGWCRHGHRLTPKNSYYYTTVSGKVHRKCRRCTIDNQRRYRERKAKTDG